MASDIIARSMAKKSNGDVNQLAEQFNFHTNNEDIHVTTTDKSNWNGYATKINQNETDILNNKNDISQLFDITKGGETVTGESSYTLTDAVDYPLMGLNLYGKSTQDGVPTPDTPVDIVSVGDSGTVNITSNNGGDITVTAAITSAMPLCGIPVESGGNYTDSNGQQWIADELIYNADGTGKVVKRTKKIVFDGAANIDYFFAIVSANGNEIWRGPVDNTLKTYNIGAFKYHSIMCSHLTTKTINSPKIGAFVFSDGNATYIRCETRVGISNTAELKNWLKNNPMTFIAALKNPQEIELTSAEVDALRTLQTFDGVTNISNDSGADMDVKYCTDKALSEYVVPITMGLQKQIDELRAAILSMGGNV